MSLIHTNSVGQDPYRFSARFPPMNVPRNAKIALCSGLLRETQSVDVTSANNQFTLCLGFNGMTPDTNFAGNPANLVDFMNPQTIRIEQGNYDLNDAVSLFGNSFSSAVQKALNDQNIFNHYHFLVTGDVAANAVYALQYNIANRVTGNTEFFPVLQGGYNDSPSTATLGAGGAGGTDVKLNTNDRTVMGAEPIQ